MGLVGVAMTQKDAVNWLLQHLQGHLSVCGCECVNCVSNPEEDELIIVKRALVGVLSQQAVSAPRRRVRVLPSNHS